jgi:PAS domain S-box-containing protein
VSELLKSNTPIISVIYRISVALAGLLLLLFSILNYPTERWEGMVLVIFVPLLAILPVGLGPIELTLVHVITLAGGLLFGPTVVAWAILAGVFFGYVFRRLAWNFGVRTILPPPPHIVEASFNFGIQVIPLVLAFGLGRWVVGYDGFTPLWPGILMPLVLFPIFHFVLYLGRIYFDNLSRSERRRTLMELFLVEVIPLPFLGIAPMTYFATQLGVLAMLGGVPLSLAALFYGMNITRIKLERRVQELSTIENISRVLRSTLELEALLTVIHQQVTQLLKVGNFYVALYDAKDGLLKYPLAVKFGERCHWPPRLLEPERLTDRVIRDGKPMLITPRNRAALAQAGLPTSDEVTEAWVGVPLITSERTIGCLAVFSTSPAAEFTQADLELLNILSGQVSVAIENALLYEQAQRRASQLEALNRIMALITASLDTQEVLAQVCKAVIELVGGQHSAVYLYDEKQNRCWLAYGENLSQRFVEQNNTLPAIQENRIHYVHSDQPVVIPDLGQSAIVVDYLDLLFAESIHALADFPLATPDGRVGILSVYYDNPHIFAPDEIELVQTLAYQAALAASNARLYAMADRALARRADQLAILENVGRELAAAINSPRLFDMILDYALRFTNSPWGGLSLYDPFTNTLEVKASRGYPQVEARYPVEQTFSGQALLTRQSVYIGDTRNMPGYVDLTNGIARSQLSIPIIHEERVLGVLTIESDRLDAYAENDQAFIGQLATQAGVAVVNAELYAEIQRRLREQSMLYQVGARLVATTELDGVMQTAVQSLEAALPGAAVAAYSWDENRTLYQLRSASEPKELSLPAFIPESELSAVRVGLYNTALIRLGTGKLEIPMLSACCPQRQVMIFPMVVNRQRLGMLVVCAAQAQVVQEEDLQLLHGMASQITISLQNALLFQSVTHGRDQLAAVLNSVIDGVMMLDRSGRILLVNQAIQKMMVLNAPALIGKFVADLPSAALRLIGYTPYEVETLAKSIEHGQGITVAKAIFNISDPKPDRVIERLVRPVLAQEGHPIGWMMVLRDVTEETQVAQARELITETLVHDLRSPVSAILSAVDIIENTIPEELKNDELIVQALRVAFNSANRVLGLVESLLDIAKLKAGRMELYITEFDSASLVMGLLGDFTPQANEVGVILRHDLAPDLPKIYADQGKIARVLTNLLDNALKFTPAGGQVQVSTQLDTPGFIAIRVSDTGPGIPEEYREKVFDRFTQIPGQKGRRRGSGLGLTFCRLAVEAHGGTIWIEPREGGGSVFAFTLPVVVKVQSPDQ